MKIISAGDTGAEQAALRVARRFGLETGGWAKTGWKTEYGPARWLSKYGILEEDEPGSYLSNNIENSDGTIWIGCNLPARRAISMIECNESGKPFIDLGKRAMSEDDLSFIIEMISKNQIRTLNVTGSRESELPGISIESQETLVSIIRNLSNITHE